MKKKTKKIKREKKLSSYRRLKLQLEEAAKREKALRAELEGTNVAYMDAADQANGLEVGLASAKRSLDFARRAHAVERKMMAAEARQLRAMLDREMSKWSLRKWFEKNFCGW